MCSPMNAETLFCNALTLSENSKYINDLFRENICLRAALGRGRDCPLRQSAPLLLFDQLHVAFGIRGRALKHAGLARIKYRLRTIPPRVRRVESRVGPPHDERVYPVMIFDEHV